MLRTTIWFACLAILGPAQAQPSADIIRGEYWIDQDLGIGANTLFEIADAPDIAGSQLPVSMAGYGPGIHTIGIRTLNADGHWSLTNFSKAMVIEAPPVPLADLTAVEYFLNEDPGFGNGSTAWTGNSPQTEGLFFNPDLTAAGTGINTLFVRTRNASGIWGLTNHCPILVIEPKEPSEIVRVETFALPGPDPGFGMAEEHLVASPETDLFEHVFDALVGPDFVQFDTLMVRSMDAEGRWSLTDHVVVDGTTRVEDLSNRTGISVSPNPFTSGISVRTDDGQPLRVILYDPQGRLVHDQMLTKEPYIDLHRFANGAYTAFFWKEQERIHRVTLIKN